jgi:hypothetical protein
MITLVSDLYCWISTPIENFLCHIIFSYLYTFKKCIFYVNFIYIYLVPNNNNVSIPNNILVVYFTVGSNVCEITHAIIFQIKQQI